MSRGGRRLGVLLAVLVLLALAASLALRLYSARRFERASARFEEQAGSLDVSTYAPAAITPRRDNVAFWLRTGAEALVWDADSSALLDRRMAALGEPWPADDETAMLDYLADNEPARELLTRAAGLDRSSFEIEYRRGVEAEIPDFLSLLRVGRVLAVEADLRQQRGEVEAALAAVHLLERLTAAQRGESVLIALLAGAAVERMYLDRLEAVLSVATGAGSLRALRRDLEHLDAATVPVQKALAADTAAVLPWVLSNTGEWPGWDSRRPVRAMLLDAARPALGAIGFNRMVAALLLEVAASGVESAAAPSARADAGEHRRRIEAIRSPLPAAAGMARLLAPNYLDAIKRAQWTESARALGRFALDLRLSRVGHGAYPAEPADLPKSAATGETAVYRVHDDGSVEIAFPDTEASWQEDPRSGERGPLWSVGSYPKRRVSTADYNLRWRLPP